MDSFIIATPSNLGRERGKSLFLFSENLLMNLIEIKSQGCHSRTLKRFKEYNSS